MMNQLPIMVELIINNKKPLLVGANTGVQTTYLKQCHYNEKAELKNLKTKHFSRDCLPNAQDYYTQQFPCLKTGLPPKNWVSVHCCFHDDRLPSLRLHLVSGAFRCFACGAKGGNILAFHQQRYSLTFRKAVSFFNTWSEV